MPKKRKIYKLFEYVVNKINNYILCKSDIRSFE